MERWIGSAAVCVNERNEVLMVLQGKEGEEKDGLSQVEDLKRRDTRRMLYQGSLGRNRLQCGSGK